jgi:3D-(3,5/4)-trihydroxycyclohexane-1,2-dione acylhydrolase (decyclizing)
VLVSAAGSHPGDLHKLWRPRDPKGYHLEYGYSCMGYEIPGALGVKIADPSREVYVIVGDGTYLMMPSEIATSVQEGYKLIIVLIDNHGFGSIGSLSRTVGSGGFGTRYRYRNAESGQLDGEVLAVDFAANAHSLGAVVFSAHSIGELRTALAEAKAADRTAVVWSRPIPRRSAGLRIWWDVPVAEVRESETVRRPASVRAAAPQRTLLFLSAPRGGA